MADNKQTPTTEEHIPPEAAGPEIPGAAPGDVVVDMDTIDELMKKRNAAARDAVEQTAEEQPPDLPTPGEEDTREPWEKTQDELNVEDKKPRRGRPPPPRRRRSRPGWRAQKSRRKKRPARAASPRPTRPPRIKPLSRFETKRPKVKRLPARAARIR